MEMYIALYMYIHDFSNYILGDKIGECQMLTPYAVATSKRDKRKMDPLSSPGTEGLILTLGTLMPFQGI